MKETDSALTGECGSDIPSLSVSRKSYSVLPSCTDVKLSFLTVVRSVDFLFFNIVITKTSI